MVGRAAGGRFGRHSGSVDPLATGGRGGRLMFNPVAEGREDDGESQKAQDDVLESIHVGHGMGGVVLVSVGRNEK